VKDTARHGGAAGAAVAALALALALGALALLGEAKKTASPDVALKSRSAGIKANHAAHVATEGLTCETCHAGAASSKKAADYLVPQSEACLECHPEAVCTGELDGPCKVCHAVKPKAYATLRVKHKAGIEIIFPHARHVAGKKVKAACRDCHAIALEAQPLPGLRKNPSLPGMRLCLECHGHLEQYDALQCGVCHLVEKGGILKTKLGGGVVLTPPSWMAGMEHGAAWTTEHAGSAANHASLCGTCHRSEDCDRCHAGTGQAMPSEIHKDDWIMMHGYASLSGDLHCAACHNLQHFCLPCHRQSGAAWDSPSGLDVPSGSVFHPEGWYAFSGVNKHASEAKSSLGSCVACHTEQDCMLCHAAPFQAFSPHPPSDVWHKKCKTLTSKNPGVCLKCHTAVPPVCK
jgi:hypothetical protein